MISTILMLFPGSVNRKNRKFCTKEGENLRRVLCVSFLLLLCQFSVPLLFLIGKPSAGAVPEVSELPSAQSSPEASFDAAAPKDAAVSVRVLMDDGSVVPMTLSAYLRGVVAAEMPASFDEEALRAQAVVARSYTYYRIAHPRAAHPDADVCTDSSCCSAYVTPEESAARWGESSSLYAEKIAAAVSDTDGEILLYDGAVAETLFHAASSGYTEDAAAVWGTAVPYLVSVPSPEGEADVPNYYAAVSVSFADFRSTLATAGLGSSLGSDPGTWFGEITRSAAGKVLTVDIGGAVLSGGAVRRLFSLRSTDFTVEVTGDAVVFHTVGYGHGVGMSQYGANVLAEEGKSYGEILAWYYTGTTLGQAPDRS